MRKNPSPVRVGTAGWSIPSRYAVEFSTDGSHLQRYARRLNCVEINSSFHRPHRRAVYERWAKATPADFRFAVKIPKTMTHERDLAGCAPLIDRFAEEVGGLGEKLAVLLIQLPPRGAVRKRVADAFFRRLRAAVPVDLAVEPRHASWFTPDLEGWLAERRIARVAADPIPRDATMLAEAARPGGWEDLAYYRWHGAPRMYYSNYPIDRLRVLWRAAESQRRSDHSVWCIFDNTAGGHATGNALQLPAALRSKA